MIDCEFDTLILSLVLIWIFYVFNFNLQLSKIISILFLYNIIYKNNDYTQEKGRAATRPFCYVVGNILYALLPISIIT